MSSGIEFHFRWILLSFSIILFPTNSHEDYFKECTDQKATASYTVIGAVSVMSGLHCGSFCILEESCDGFNLMTSSQRPYQCDLLSLSLITESCQDAHIANALNTLFFFKGKNRSNILPQFESVYRYFSFQ